MTSWTHGYKGHYIHGKVEGNKEQVQVQIMDRQGPGFRLQDVKSYRSAKILISRHVNRKVGIPLDEIVRTTAWLARGVNIEVDTAYGTVAIGKNIFMQGDEAEQFIKEAEELYEKAQYVSMDDCYACLAEPYLECVEN